MDAEETKPHIVGYSVLFAVWAALLGLTWLTVGLSGTGLGSFVIVAPFLIASVKAFLVVDYFMHLKYESGFFKYILLVVLGMVVVVAWLVYQDVAYRY
ncbi:MAG: cytochrome C oxidase subunit IV family protein [Deltaproteobacteria bacterium]|nr:cytochrome C oxidase subunit IV family protein [Deltaproteobacteria bacterium]